MLKNEESFNLVSNHKPYFFGNGSHTVFLSKIRKYPTKSVTNFLSKYVSSFGLYCFVKFLFENSGE